MAVDLTCLRCGDRPKAPGARKFCGPCAVEAAREVQQRKRAKRRQDPRWQANLREYNNAYRRRRRDALSPVALGPHLDDIGPILGPIQPKCVQCETCDRWFVVTTWARRFCSGPCLRVSLGHMARTCDIVAGNCIRCGDAFVRPAHHAHNQTCSPTCSKALSRSRRKHRRRAGVSDGHTLREIAERDNWRCHLCGKKVPDRKYSARDDDPTIDHLIPVSHGGHDVRENVALAHNRCNWERGNAGLAQLRLVG